MKPVKEKKLLKGLVVKYNKVNALLDRCSRKEVSSIMKKFVGFITFHQLSKPLTVIVGRKRLSRTTNQKMRNAVELMIYFIIIT